MESKKPLVSLILGICGIVFVCVGPGLPCAVAALIVSNIAINQGFDDSKAKIGRILGIVGIVLGVIAYIGAFILGVMSGMSGSY